MSDVEPYPPLGVLKPFGDGLWVVDGPLVRMDFGPTSLPFPTRMTVAQLPDGGLWVHSPVTLDDALRDALAAIGPVKALVAPNRLHLNWLGDWRRAYPEAGSWGVEGVKEAAEKAGLAPPETLLGEPPVREWGGGVSHLIFEGSYLTEGVFYHHRSATLVLTDLLENFEPRKVKNGLLRLLMRLGGVMRPGSTPRDLRLAFLGPKREAARDAALNMLDWGPDRVVVAHGALIEDGAETMLRKAFAWTGLKEIPA